MNNIIDKYYYPLIQGIRMLKDTCINSVICKSKTGLGKSYMIDNYLNELNCDFVIFKGAVSEARFWEFISENNDKIIVLRDCGNLLRHLTFLDFLKSATDIMPVRKIQRLNYSEHRDVPETIDFTGKIIFEINDIPKKFEEDLEAVFSRSLFLELNFSIDEIKEIMFQICQNQEQKDLTNYLISKIDLIGYNSFNLRTQAKMFQIQNNAITNKLDWKKEVDEFLKIEISEPRKLMYRLVGNGTIKRMELVKFMMRTKGISYSTAQRRIDEAIYLEEYYTNGLQKQAMLSINKIEEQNE